MSEVSSTCQIFGCTSARGLTVVDLPLLGGGVGGISPHHHGKLVVCEDHHRRIEFQRTQGNQPHNYMGKVVNPDGTVIPELNRHADSPLL